MRNEPYNNQDDPTDPVRHSSAPQQGRQGDKLILGSFQDPSKRSERRPYQYPYSSYPQAGQQASPGGAYTPQYPNTPGVQRNPYPQQGQMPPGTPQQRPRRRRKGCLITSLVVLLLVCIIGVLTITTAQRVLAFGSAISTQSPLSTQTSYMGTGDRVNLLVMGFGGSGHDGAYLTDSMVVMSLLPQSHHTTLISVPRDLWVQIPPGSGQYHKINASYEYGSNNNAKPADGGNAAAAKISLVTGLDVKYWLTINFQGFREFIDSIGGIDVYVPDSFTANYPANDDPNINPNWIKVHFSKGMQHMNGETAIRYARARYVLDNPAEGSDFARSARQQIMIKAALSKVKQMSTWPSLYNALNALQHTIYTNMSLADLMQFALKMDLTNAHRVGLSNQNVLASGTAPDGEYILKPANGNWQAIVDYVKQQLYN
ncbi:MAG: LytR family transcriptional regulator [Chloroflexi bacterium]|nr:MAG: LytR family transcriptional regulator [Chloroflexota bacterium]